MRNTLLAAIAVVGLFSGAAFAGESSVQDAFSFHAPGVTTILSPSYRQAPSLPDPLTATVLPTDGSEGILQTVGSLPRGFENGTVAMTQLQSEQRSAIARAARHTVTQAPGISG